MPENVVPNFEDEAFRSFIFYGKQSRVSARTGIHRPENRNTCFEGNTTKLSIQNFRLIDMWICVTVARQCKL